MVEVWKTAAWVADVIARAPGFVGHCGRADAEPPQLRLSEELRIEGLPLFETLDCVPDRLFPAARRWRKRQRLLGVGADVVIPDFRDAGPLLDRIFSA